MDKLTKKQKGFVKDYIDTGNATESALNNYDTEDRRVAQTIGSENLSKPIIKEVIESLADRISDDKLYRVLNEGLDAENNEKPDYAIRHKYLDTSLKLKGLYEGDDQKKINVLMPILVRFLNVKDDEPTSNDRHTNRISETL